MSDERKTYVVVTLNRGTREIRATAKRFARKAALARGWLVIEIYEKKEEAKKAA